MDALTGHLTREHVRACGDEHLAQHLRRGRRDRRVDRRPTARKKLEEAGRRAGYRGHPENGRESSGNCFGINLQTHDRGDLTQHADLQSTQRNGVRERDRGGRDQGRRTHFDVDRPACLGDLELERYPLATGQRMPLGIRQLLVDRTDEIRQAERCERDAGDIVLFCQRLEALPVEDRKLERGEIPGEPVRAAVVWSRTLGEHQGDQHFLRQRPHYLGLDGLETLVPGPDAVQAEMDAGVIVAHLPSDLVEIRVRYPPRLYSELDARSVIHGDREIRAVVALDVASNGRTDAGRGDLLAEDRIDQRALSYSDTPSKHDVELRSCPHRLGKALAEEFLKIEFLVTLRLISK